MMYLQALVQQQNISGNLDEPEGGLDALMQVAVCEQVRSVVVRMNELPTLLELEEVRWGGGGRGQCGVCLRYIKVLMKIILHFLMLSVTINLGLIFLRRILAGQSWTLLAGWLSL